jgi:glycogen operon protein
MVASFHEAGLEVILDVVYNHTAEGNERGPTLSFRGFDNASYYRLMPEERRYYINDTGTGNTLNLSHPRVLQMVTDSLRYWVQQTHVDGFRFDLGTISHVSRTGSTIEWILEGVQSGSSPGDCQTHCRTLGFGPGG